MERVRQELGDRIWNEYLEAHGKAMDEADFRAEVDAQFREAYEEAFAKEIKVRKELPTPPPLPRRGTQTADPLLIGVYPPPPASWSWGTLLALAGILAFLVCIGGLSVIFLFSGPGLDLETRSPESWKAGFDDGYLVGKTAAAEIRPRNPELARRFAEIHAAGHSGDQEAYEVAYKYGYNEGWHQRDELNQAMGLPPGRQLRIRIFQ
jgi:hypothetical protein